MSEILYDGDLAMYLIVIGFVTHSSFILYESNEFYFLNFKIILILSFFSFIIFVF